MSKVVALFYYDNEKYDKLAYMAYDSFVKWHPNIDVKVIRALEPANVGIFADFYKYPGIMKYITASTMMREQNYDKVICLGVDMITCGYLNEFIELEEDIGVSLDYAARKIHNQSTMNADVACFNNIEMLESIIGFALKYFTTKNAQGECFFEQGALNELILRIIKNKIENKEYTYETYDGDINDLTFNIVDDEDKDVYYNVRSKGPIETGVEPNQEFINDWYVKDEKLYAPDNKQIKVWHFCHAFGEKTKHDIDDIIKKYRYYYFNKETIKFFQENCNLKGFK